MFRKVWDVITYPLPNFKSCTVQVWEWIVIFIQHIIIDAIMVPGARPINDISIEFEIRPKFAVL